MRSFLDKEMFFNKMKKKPAVQEVLDNLDKYTAEQIEGLTGSHFPQWIRDQLVLRKTKTTNTDARSRAEIIANMMNEASKQK